MNLNKLNREALKTAFCILTALAIYIFAHIIVQLLELALNYVLPSAFTSANSKEFLGAFFLLLRSFFSGFCAVFYLKHILKQSINLQSLFFKKIKTAHLLYVPLFLIVCVFCTFIASFIGAYFGTKPVYSATHLPQNGAALVVTFAALCVVSPILEELFFRGILQNLVFVKHPYTCMVFVSLIFAVLHGSFETFLNTFTLSLVLCLTYYKTKTLAVCILLHALYNTIIFVLNSFLTT